MSDFVLALEALRQQDANRAGGKAAVLGTLLETGFPVPPGLCVTTAAFHAALAPFRPQIHDLLHDLDLREPDTAAEQATIAAANIAALLADLVVPEPVASAICAGFPTVAGDDMPVAVRSSATAEDRADASFAGQYSTVLGVRGEAAVLAAVVECWRSFFTANSIVARSAHGALQPDEAMAVLIQRMVDAECAGVCFSIDPVQQRRDTVVIDAVWGLGIGAVDGSVATDTSWIRRERLSLRQRRITEKLEHIVLAADGGVQRVPVPDDRRHAACLPEGWATRVAEFGIAAELVLGRPQDIEWAVANKQVWVLQSRPITALPPELQESPPFPVAWTSEQDRRCAWGLGGNNTHEPVLPLESDIFDYQEGAWQDATMFLGYDESFRRMAVNGRLYYNEVPSTLRDGDRRIRKAASADLVARLWNEGKTSWEHWGPEVVTAAERLMAFDCAAADGPGLAQHLEDALGVLRRHWFIHWLLFPWPLLSNPFETAFGKVSGLGGEAAEHARARLLEGEETKLTQLIDGLYGLAETARTLPDVVALVAAPGPDVRTHLQALPEAAAFCAQLDAFLMTYGDRTGSGFGSETTLRTPTWHERPDLVLALVAPYLDPNVEAPGAARSRAREERARALETLCAACSDEAAVAELRAALPLARRCATDLEEHNHYIDQMSTGHLRAAVLAAGQGLVARGVIVAAEDVYWLRLDEVLSMLRAESPTMLVELVVERKAQHEAWSVLVPPPLLGTPRSSLGDRPPLKDEVTVEAPEEAMRIRGQAASPGVRRGRARIVPGSVLMPDLKPGEILVAENAGPGWTPLFPILGGIVLDEGALTQHAATTAREYGIPAVMQTRHATLRIPDGAWITIDGSTGTVEIEG